MSHFNFFRCLPFLVLSWFTLALTACFLLAAPVPQAEAKRFAELALPPAPAPDRLAELDLPAALDLPAELLCPVLLPVLLLPLLDAPTMIVSVETVVCEVVFGYVRSYISFVIIGLFYDFQHSLTSPSLQC